MKSGDGIKKAEKVLSDKIDHAAQLKNKYNQLELGRQVMDGVYAAEEVLRAMGFTIKHLGTEGVEIKCKWSDAPEAIKNGKKV